MKARNRNYWLMGALLCASPMASPAFAWQVAPVDPATKAAMDKRAAARALLSSALSRIATNGTDTLALFDAGRASIDLDDYRTAMGFLLRAEQGAPRDSAIKAALGTTMVHLENPTRALDYFGEAQLLGAPERLFLADRALARDLLGQQDAAQRDYQLALATMPNEETQRRYALSLGISGEADRAIQLLTPQLRSQNRSAWRTRAMILAINGRSAEATEIVNATMPAVLAQNILPYLGKLDRLNPAQQAAAAHFGRFPTDPLGPSRAPVQLASAAPAPAASTPATGTSSSGRVSERERASSRINRPVASPPPRERSRPGQQVAAVAAPAASQPAPAATAPAASRPVPTPAPDPTPAPVRVAALATPPPAPASIPTPAPTPTPDRSSAMAAPSTSGPSAPVASGDQAPVLLSTLTPAIRPDTQAVPTSESSVERPSAPPALAQVDPSQHVAAAGTTPVVATPVPAPAATAVATAATPIIDPIGPGFSIAAIGSAPTQAATAPVTGATPALIGEAADMAAAVPVADPVKDAALNSIGVPAAAPLASLAEIANSIEIPEDELAASEGAVDAATLAKLREDRRKAAAEAAAAKREKDAAAAKEKAEADTKAKAEADEKKSNPARLWVQVATGANERALVIDYGRFAKQHAELFKGQSGGTAEWNKTRRLLVGPFKDRKSAQGWLDSYKKAGGNGFLFNSEAGQTVNPIK